MIAINDLHQTAREYLRAAKLLRTRRSYDAATYLCGYAVEIALKARICRALKWNAGFPETSAEFQEKGSLLKTHTMKILLEYTTIQDQIRSAALLEWSVMLKWSPEQRYNPIGTKNADDADEIIAAAQKLLRLLL
jgi:HEPN domain-containing protein